MIGSNKYDQYRLGTPHGFGDDPRSLILQRRPGPRTLEWARDTLGVTILAVRALRGGSSSAIHALRVAGRDGPTAVILRAYVLAEVVEEEPDIVEREAAALGILRRASLPAPEPLGQDPTGDDAGVPALLMTRLPGRVVWSPGDLGAWLTRLAEALPVLHAAAVKQDERVEEFRPYQPETWAPPTWMRRPALWERAVEVFHRPPMDPDRAFIHRDYHPGNVLWRRGRISGLVDWQSASLGPRTVDVCHCRVNLVDRFGLEVADHFLHIWKAATGAEYHPWAEVVMLVDALGWRPRQRGERSARELESALAERLSELGA